MSRVVIVFVHHDINNQNLCGIMAIIEDKSFDRYIKDISKEHALTSEEENILAKRISQGDNIAKEALITANLRFVVFIANKYRGLGVDMVGLISEGNIGLLHAASKFDASRGRFTTYAEQIVRNAIERAVNRHSDLERGVEVIDKNKKTGCTLSVDAPLRGRNNVNLLCILKNTNSPEPDLLFDNKENLEQLISAMNCLDDRERLIISKIYGIGTDRFSMADIAAEMGIKRERVRQIRDKCMRKLSRQLKHNKNS